MEKISVHIHILSDGQIDFVVHEAFIVKKYKEKVLDIDIDYIEYREIIEIKNDYNEHKYTTVGTSKITSDSLNKLVESCVFPIQGSKGYWFGLFDSLDLAKDAIKPFIQREIERHENAIKHLKEFDITRKEF